MALGEWLLKWVGIAFVLMAPLIWLLNRQRSSDVLTELALGLLVWTAMFAAWKLTTAFLRWWILGASGN